MTMSHALQRFLDAQAPVYERAKAELGAGAKKSHWMWFVFPQIAGLGHSPTAQFYAIASLEEAQAYAAHPVLGPRLIECTRLVLAHSGTPIGAIFGSPDDLKFCSSMTLFARATGKALYREALDTFFSGVEDQATLARL
jgi:uncharacterized protein (DUF1810 family)